MTKDELRRIFDEAEQKICTPELYSKIVAEITDPTKPPPENAEGLAIRVNRIIYREILIEVLAKVLADK